MPDTTETTDSLVTPEEYLTDLAHTLLRTIALPLPRDPAAFGWQMTAGGLAALAAKLLHLANRVAPEETADIVRLHSDPLHELHEEVEWIDAHVAKPAGADINEWIDQAHQAAELAANAAVTEDVEPLPGGQSV